MGYLDYAGLQYLWGKLKEKFAPKSHSHDDRYYTEAEMDGKLNSKVNNNEAGANGLLSKLTTSWTATPTDNTYFIRQDTGGGDSFGRVKFSTLWNYIKGKADGVYQSKGSYAASGHVHDDRYYTENEMNTKLSAKAENIVLAYNANLDNITTPGFYSCGGGNSISNKPTGTDAIGLIVTHNASGDYYTQILTTSSNANTYRRTCLNGTWSGWTQDKYTDTNTWRGIQNNLTSDSTSDSLSAAQGKALKALVDGKASSEHTHGLNSSSLTKSVDNATTNSWDMVGGNKSFLLRSLRMQSKAPDWLEGNYAAGIAFGGSDTKGVISHAYSYPSIKFAGGNGAAPVWWLRLTGTSGKSYDLNAMPPASHTHSFSSITDKPSTYTPSAHNQSWSTITDKPALMESGDYSAETIEALLKRVQGSSPRMGSCCFTKDTHVANTWWNFIYTPHRTGFGGDNPEYGTLLLFPMVGAGSSYIVRAGKDGVVKEIRKIYTSGDKPTKGDVGLGNVDNTADANKSVKYATSAGSASTATKATTAGTADKANSVDWSKVQNKPSSYPPSSHSHAYLPLGGGTISGQIKRDVGCSWIYDRDNAIVYGTSSGTSTGYHPVIGQKTPSGAWTIGTYSDERLIFDYTTDANKTAGTNNGTQVYLPAQAGTIITSATIGSQSVNYANSAGNATNAANATTATKLSSNAGSSVQPVYFSGGKPVAIGYTISSSVPANAKFTDTTYGVASSSSNGLMSSTDKTKLDDFSRVINIQKQIKLTTDWLDTGIAGNSLDTGTYVVQVSGFNSSHTQLYSEIYSGVMSWYSGTTNSGNSSEIFLHNAGLADNNNAIYLRTLRVAGSKTLKLQIACKVAATGTDTLTFKFRRLI